MDRLLEGRTAIVTGAAGGVGLATARLFAEAGARLLVTDADEALLESEMAPLIEHGAEIHRWSCDLKAKLGVSNLIASAMDKLGRIDILVNSSLTAVQGDLLGGSAEDMDAAYESNVRAPFVLAQATARRMIETHADQPADAPACAIINITSIVARRTVPALLSYSVSCAALDQLTRAMAVSLAEHRIRVNGVALGAVMSRQLKAAFSGQAGLREALISATPMNRIGEAAEAAEAVLYLASPKASFVTGQIVSVDGGRTVLDPLATPTQ
jgi:7-alpha-hydroxysteroid dehydrogenase